MDFYAILDQVVDLLRQRQRVTYRALQRQFQLDDAFLEDVKVELIKGQRLAVDEGGEVLVWIGEAGSAPTPISVPAEPPGRTPLTYTPPYLAEKILTSRSALEGERKQVTVLFVDVSGFTLLSERLDPEDVHSLMTRAFELMLAEVHCYEGTVNQFLGDGIMALFGAPIAHEDHARRAVHAALGIRQALEGYQAELQRRQGISFQVRQGLNTGLVVVGSIGNDLRMDYTAVGDTTNVAARLQTTADPGRILVTEATHRLVAGYFHTRPWGSLPSRGRPHRWVPGR
jgi:class 3 adenylate cyclase